MQILEERGLQVYLVNARYAKNVPGRRTDVSDCQWLQYLHAVGALKASFRPAQDICAVRSLVRHRNSLVELATCHVQHMQKALDQMNLQLHHVISDVMGTTGLAIIDAILAGERDPAKLAALRDPRIRATEQIIVKSLVGHYRGEHLFTLKQPLALYREYEKQISECESEVQRFMKTLAANTNHSTPLSPAKDSVKKCKVMSPAKALCLREEAHRILGVDLTTVPGISVLHIQAVVAEVGPDLSRFRSPAAFASWLGFAQIMMSVAARSFGPEHEGSKTASRPHCGWPLNRFRAAVQPLASSIGVCAVDWELPKRLPRQLTNSPGSSTIC